MPRLERPGDEAPGQLGVARLAFGDALEHGARQGIGAVGAELGGFQRCQRFADAALGDRAEDDAAQIRLGECTGERQRARAEVSRAVAAGEREAILGMADLVRKMGLVAQD